VARVLLAEGREAEVFEWGDGKVLRLMREGEPREQMERGVAAMRAAEACGVPVPHVDEVVVVDGRPGVVMDRIDGQDLMTVLGSRPWTVVRAARDLGSLHAQLHDTVAPPELVSLRDHARRRIEDSILPATLIRFAIGALDELPDGDRLLHGDYHPGNVLFGSSGPVIIDWTNATRGDPAADVARTRLMLRVGDLPPGSSALLRRVDRLGRGYFAWAYLRSYRKHAPMDDALLDRWEVVRAADRISEGIEPEIPTLVELLERTERASRR
jgi:aminoglycoside phosphotransferase (APT) family kinase protein